MRPGAPGEIIDVPERRPDYVTAWVSLVALIVAGVAVALALTMPAPAPHPAPQPAPGPPVTIGPPCR